MYQQITYPSSDKKTTIYAYIWRPRGQIRGVVHIIHGMAEYALRYNDFAEYLSCKAKLFTQCKKGFANLDDEHFAEVTAQAVCPVQTFGLNEKADLRASDIALTRGTDFLGVDAGGGFFQYGYMIQQISAEEFRETGQQALEQGLLSGSAAGQVRAILADLKDTDNDVIMLARLKD